MFELYSKNNKIPDNIAKIIHEILIDNLINREENIGKERKDFTNDEIYNKWLNMLRNENDYYILVYYYNNEIVAFINYSYMNKGLCLCEVQIKREYQGKYNILRYMINHILNTTDRSKYNNVCGTIGNNQRSKDVFTHIGMKHTIGHFYEISVGDLEKWINKYGKVKER